jgi:phosphatidylglycerophosphatase C
MARSIVELSRIVNAPRPTLVIFDLDHTLVHLDSFAGFSRGLILRDWWRVAATLLVLPLAVTLALFTRTRRAALSMFVWLDSVGLDRNALDVLMDAYVARRFAGGRLVCERAVEALLEHRAAGARVLIATGCESALAVRVCRAIGAGELEVVGSALQPWCGGWIAKEHCHGARKLALLRAQLACDQWDCVYTDSAADLPILLHGTRRIVVNPRPTALAKIAAALGEGFEVRDWRMPGS